MNKRMLATLLLICALVLPACGTADSEEPETATLILATFNPDGYDREAVDNFNRSHKKSSFMWQTIGTSRAESAVKTGC